MADKKISQLSSASTPLAGTEVLPIVQSSTTVKVATDDLTVKNVRSNATTGILQIAGPAAAATRTMTVPDANFTAARTDAAQTFTGTQTIDGTAIVSSTNQFLVGTTSLPGGAGVSGVGVRNVSGIIGQLLIGKTASGTVDAQVFYYGAAYVGGIQISDTATAVITSSDARLKKNIKNADDAGTIIDAILVRQFDWKINNTHERYGFIAQELKTVLPEAISSPSTEDAVLGVDLTKIVPVLVKEIQSLRARVAKLEG